jgi:shikimate kinase
MILSLIGMSGSGKTHWSRKLAEAGYERLGCDDRIGPRLAAEGHLKGTGGIESVARWMGQPYEPGYAAREAAYLAAERGAVGEMLDVIESGLNRTHDGEPAQERAAKLAIDTTGSFVYLGEEICRRLQAQTTIVYLETSPEELELMFRQYLADPKPVVWNDAFRRRDGESDEQALARCYQVLLQTRRGLYDQFATVKLSAARLRLAQPGAGEFLRLVQQQLDLRQESRTQRQSDDRP